MQTQQISVFIPGEYNKSFIQSFLERQSPNADGIFSYQYNDDTSGTTYKLEVLFQTSNANADYVVFFNKIKQNVEFECFQDKIFSIQQEPYIKSDSTYHIPFKNEFFKQEQTYEATSKTFTFVEELLATKKAKYIPHHPMLYFMLDSRLSFKELESLPLPTKTKILSCIASMDKAAFAGHLKRSEFVQNLHNLIMHRGGGITCDFYGNGIQKISQKSEGILPYQYSIAIENSQTPHYFSEKIIDCFLGYCMPIYCGAPNIYDYFPKESLVLIDINQPESAYEIITHAIQNNLWQKNQKAILEARRLCLYQYNFIYGMGQIIAQDFLNTPTSLLVKKSYALKAVKRTLLSHIQRNAWRLGNYLHLV